MTAGPGASRGRRSVRSGTTTGMNIMKDDIIRETIENELRQKFEEGLEAAVQDHLEATREEREELLADSIAEFFQQQFEDGLEEQIEAELERVLEEQDA
jgi:hypothetical protein